MDVDIPNQLLDHVSEITTRPPEPKRPSILTEFFDRANYVRRLSACVGGVHIDGPPPSVTLGTTKALELAWAPLT